MTQPLNEIIESKAKELYEWPLKFDKRIRPWDSVKGMGVHVVFKDLARHFLASEIKARIDERKNVQMGFKKERIKALEEQLKEIEKI